MPSRLWWTDCWHSFRCPCATFKAVLVEDSLDYILQKNASLSRIASAGTYFSPMVNKPSQEVSRSEGVDDAERKLRLILLLASSVLIIYLSLFPLTGWRDPGVPFWNFLFSWPRTVSRADIATNLLAYAVPGFLYCWWRGGGYRLHSVVQATLGCALLSFTMESLQTYLPAREASTVDLVANTAGAFAGAMLANLVVVGPVSKKLRSVRREWFLPGHAVDVGLLALGLWVLSQWSPLVPLMDVGAIRHALSPAWQTLHNLGRFQPMQAAAYAFNLTGLGLLCSLLGAGPARPLFCLLQRVPPVSCC